MTQPIKSETAVAKQYDYTKIVQKQIEELAAQKAIVVPPDYIVGNAIQEAYLNLLTVTDRNGKPAIEVCDPSSIIRAIRNMVIQGLTVGKKQAYFIVYGNQLNMSRSYFGTMAVAKRFGNVKDIRSEVIVEGDEVSVEIINGEMRIHSHKPVSFFDRKVTYENIKGAYAIVTLKTGEQKWEVMNRDQIMASWNKSKSQQGTHKEFPDQMAKKTVISRALKMIINSSDDSSMLVQAFNESGYIDGDEEDGKTGASDSLPDTAFTNVISADTLKKEHSTEIKTDTQPAQPIVTIAVEKDPF